MSEIKNAASIMARKRWKGMNPKARKDFMKKLRAKRDPGHQSKAAQALAKQMTKAQKRARALLGVAARRLKRELNKESVT